ncbi:MAG TPA: hypothetical protein VD994_12220 [Prosthecobacter sp.]|nr:hypothetical protein [Prosthecobacter sp.]
MALSNSFITSVLNLANAVESPGLPLGKEGQWQNVVPAPKTGEQNIMKKSRFSEENI